MSFLQAVVLAVVQGATEFLPVSSSGHLVIVPALLGWNPAPMEYVIVVHFGTLVAVIAYYRNDVFAILKSLFSFGGKKDTEQALGNTDGRYLALLILVASVPAAIVGLTLEDHIDHLFTEAGTMPVGIGLLLTASLLYVADRMVGTREAGELTHFDALLVGVAQAVAILPGISRSGSCISGSLWRGLSREWAPKFAFLMSIPPIAGAFALALRKLARSGDLLEQMPLYLTGMVVSAAVGYVAIYGVVRSVQHGRLFVRFGIYCLALGLVGILGGALGWI